MVEVNLLEPGRYVRCSDAVFSFGRVIFVEDVQGLSKSLRVSICDYLQSPACDEVGNPLPSYHHGSYTWNPVTNLQVFGGLSVEAYSNTNQRLSLPGLAESTVNEDGSGRGITSGYHNGCGYFIDWSIRFDGLYRCHQVRMWRYPTANGGYAETYETNINSWEGDLTGHSPEVDLWLELTSIRLIKEKNGIRPSWIQLSRVKPYSIDYLRSMTFEGLRDFALQGVKIPWREMARDAYQNLGMWDGNGLAYVEDLKNLRSLIKSSEQTILNLKRNPAKAFASLYLSIHYGYKLFIMDTKELLEALLRLQDFMGVQMVTAQGDYGPAHAVYQVNYLPLTNVLTDLGKLIQYFDLDITSENVWDMIPYSFVVDWFFGIGEVLTSLDNFFTLTRQCDVLCCSESISIRKDLPSLVLTSGFTGTLSLKYYQRRYFRNPVTPSFLPPSNLSTLLPHHWVEAGALFISNR